MKGRILIIAGSDSGGGAGIQGDIKTVSALGGYAMTAITAITVQNTVAVSDVHAIPAHIIAAQINVTLDDIGVDAFKTGMLHDAEVIETIAAILSQKAKHIPCVVDPVMISKSGNALLQANAITSLKEKLLPLATLITPNIPEAEALLGHTIKDIGSAARELAQFGSKAVLLKGGHAQGDTITDVLWDGATLHQWQSPRIDTQHTHGTGCTLASAIAVSLGQGMPLVESVVRAREYVIGAIKNAPGYGHGHGPLNHSWNNG
jgi:hydroxymethylpyrimidine/phosphomethylpyrimidine kinase